MPHAPNGKYALDDTFLHERLRQVILERNIQVVVETGLNEGLSTLAFCRMAPKVIGIDIDPVCLNAAQNTLNRGGVANFELLHGNSPDVLNSIMARLPLGQTMFFLDAHWGPGPWVLPKEILAIPKGQNVMVFHDIKVPGKDFGADGYVQADGTEKEFEYALIKDVLTEWSPRHRIEYMDQANGSYRGAAIAYPI